ncbi:hypothetical protein Trydic_g22598 [Trypoxylus dichotomus]
MESGVQHGSVLGLVLFTIYIKCILKSQDYRVLNVIYADDTAATSGHPKIARTEMKWCSKIEYLGMILDQRPTFTHRTSEKSKDKDNRQNISAIYTHLTTGIILHIAVRTIE